MTFIYEKHPKANTLVRVKRFDGKRIVLETGSILVRGAYDIEPREETFYRWEEWKDGGFISLGDVLYNDEWEYL